MSVSVSAAGSAASSSQTTPAAATATVDYNQFLKLLIAQIQNQDPTSPTDPTQYMSQLASFSAVEQQIKTNSALDALLSVQSGALIGRVATSADGETSGVIASVTAGGGGTATAVLSNGGEIELGSGVKISA
ncbi:flagellar hook assembly protein FlgD [Methylocella sp.]|uniref:flagellar hook assembly protein FlgD n=1 Tax=Methylocella sp. TaxID=1978226 RepID=UPI003782E18C